jgi:hypothetical protein
MRHGAKDLFGSHTVLSKASKFEPALNRLARFKAFAMPNSLTTEKPAM